MKRHVVTVFGLALTASSTLAACGKDPEGPATNPPPIDVPPEPPTANPPPPEPPPTNPPNPSLPTWEEVKSGHPEGATNPPRPVLTVTPDGARCWKEWVGGMMPPTPTTVDRVITSDPPPQSTEIVCPPRAQDILAKKKPPSP